jgi:hypothetical protein
MTFHPQSSSGPRQNENNGNNTARPVPLDRSSAEWRSQFGVLPSAWQQYRTTRPAPGHGALSVAAANPAKKNKNPLSFLTAIAGIVVVAGLLAYGYFPLQETDGQRKGEPALSRGRGAIGSSVSFEKLRNRTADHSTAPAPAVLSTAVSARALTAVKPPVKTASARRPRRAVRASPRPQAAIAGSGETGKQDITAPRARREAPKAPAVRATAVAAAAPLATAPRLQRASSPLNTRAEPSPAPVTQQSQSAPRPSTESSFQNGTNPLGLPQ